MSELLSFLGILRDLNISYVVEHSHEDALMVRVAKLEEYWEVVFYENGSVEAQLFTSDSKPFGKEALDLIVA